MKSNRLANRIAVIFMVVLLLSLLYVEGSYFNYIRNKENSNNKLSSNRNKFNELNNSIGKYSNLYDSI